MKQKTQKPAPPSLDFELDGDAVCIDYVNTWSYRDSGETDKLCTGPAVAAFARQAKLLSQADAAGLANQVAADPNLAKELLQRARSLRDTLYSLFSSRAAGRALPVADLEALNREVAQAYLSPRLQTDRQGIHLAWAKTHSLADQALASVVRSAVDLMTGPEFEYLRECDGATCSWMFIDHSRNHSRRWCSMRTCGNRAKARRHYRRQQGERGT